MRTLQGQSIPDIQAPSSLYPYGRAKNSNPPSAKNGTPLKEELIHTDINYGLLALMKEANITPNESPEDIDNSQIKDSILSLIGNTEKVIVSVQENISDIKYLCKVGSRVNGNNYNTWLGVCEAENKLVIQGKTTLKVRNRTGIAVFATKGTNVFAGDVDEFGAGFIQVANNDNTDLKLSNNIVGELANDFNFTDTVQYFDVEVIVHQKPMLQDIISYWTENAVLKTVTPSQPGISISDISPEWDQAIIEDSPRVIFTENGVVIYGSGPDEGYTFFNNIAINDLAQTVTTSGGDGSIIRMLKDQFFIEFYEASAVPGSIATLKYMATFNKSGNIDTNGSIILEDRNLGSHVDGEIWKDQSNGLIKCRENGVDYNVVNIGVNGSFNYRFASPIVAPPVNGTIRLNNAIQENSTEIYVSDITDGSVDVSSIMQSWTIGAQFFIFDASSSANYLKFEIVTITPQTGYTTFGISLISQSGSSFSNNQDILLYFFGSGGGGTVEPLLLMKALKGSSQPVTGGIPFKVTYNSEQQDDGNNYNPSNSTYTNGPSGANATIGARARCTTAAPGVVTIFIYKDGVAVAGNSVEIGTANTFWITTTCTERLSPSDTIEVYIQQSTGFTMTIENPSATAFSVVKQNI